MIILTYVLRCILFCNINYSNELKSKIINKNKDVVEKPKKKSTSHATDAAKAVHLGILSIDIGYTTLFEKKSASQKFLVRIENTLEDLDIRSPEIELASEAIRSSIDNKDSVITAILKYQNIWTIETDQTKQKS